MTRLTELETLLYNNSELANGEVNRMQEAKDIGLKVAEHEKETYGIAHFVIGLQFLTNPNDTALSVTDIFIYLKNGINYVTRISWYNEIGLLSKSDSEKYTKQFKIIKDFMDLGEAEAFYLMVVRFFSLGEYSVDVCIDKIQAMTEKISAGKRAIESLLEVIKEN